MEQLRRGIFNLLAVVVWAVTERRTDVNRGRTTLGMQRRSQRMTAGLAKPESASLSASSAGVGPDRRSCSARDSLVRCRVPRRVPQGEHGYRLEALRRVTIEPLTANDQIEASLGEAVAEKNSYRSFQRNYGHSVRDRAPGSFITGLLRKAESAGGVTREGDPRISAPSQSCVCGARKKKPLSLRVHTCSDCGTGPIQRDVFSAFLWRHINPDGTLDAPKAR